MRDSTNQGTRWRGKYREGDGAYLAVAIALAAGLGPRSRERRGRDRKRGKRATKREGRREGKSQDLFAAGLVRPGAVRGLWLWGGRPGN